MNKTVNDTPLLIIHLKIEKSGIPNDMVRFQGGTNMAGLRTSARNPFGHKNTDVCSGNPLPGKVS